MKLDIDFDKIATKRYVVLGNGQTKEEKEANLWVLFGYEVIYDSKGNIKHVDYKGEDKAPLTLKYFSRAARPTIYVQISNKEPEIGMQRNGTVIDMTHKAVEAVLEEFKARFPNEVI